MHASNKQHVHHVDEGNDWQEGKPSVAQRVELQGYYDQGRGVARVEEVAGGVVGDGEGEEAGAVPDDVLGEGELHDVLSRVKSTSMMPLRANTETAAKPILEFLIFINLNKSSPTKKRTAAQSKSP